MDELDIWERKKSGTIVAPEEVHTAAPLMWRFPSASAYPDSPDSVERGFGGSESNRRSIHIESRRSSTTMQDISQKNIAGRSKSEVSVIVCVGILGFKYAKICFILHISRRDMKMMTILQWLLHLSAIQTHLPIKKKTHRTTISQGLQSR